VILDAFADDLQSMPGLHFTVFAGFATLAALALFVLIWRNLRRARLVEDTPTARIRSAPQGYVELEGRASELPDTPVVAPLTGTRCVWYRFRIQEEEDDAHGSGWSTLESGVSEAPFAFSDGSGDCVVDPRGAEVIAAVREVWRGNARWPDPARRRSRFGAGRYRYTEERILPGSCYLLGWFETETPASGPVGGETAALLRRWKSDPAGLVRRWDGNGDGRIDADEWERAREAARRHVLRDRARRSAAPARNRVRRPDAATGLPYILAARPQQVLGRRYRLRAAGSLIGAVLAAAVLAWMLAARF